MVYIYHSFLIHSSADGHLGCFHVLAMINSAAMNRFIKIFLKEKSYSLFELCLPQSQLSKWYPDAGDRLSYLYDKISAPNNGKSTFTL